LLPLKKALQIGVCAAVALLMSQTATVLAKNDTRKIAGQGNGLGKWINLMYLVRLVRSLP
jgi:hypothetical protein